MNSPQQLHRRPTDWLLDSQLAPYVDTFTHYFSKRRYSAHTTVTKLACIAHFGRWLSLCRLDIHRIDENVVQRFLDEHLPQCKCVRPVRRNRNELRA